MEYFLRDDLHADFENGKFTVHLSNGEDICAIKDTIHPETGASYAWKVGTQYFDDERFAEHYLRKLIAEKLTGVRIVYHKRGNVPQICGVNGAACRAPGKCNRALCNRCPVAEAFFTDRDGVELIYAI